jgi:hypothetical protein
MENNMAFQMVAYGTLKKSIVESIDTLLKYHGVVHANSLDKSRRIEVQYLEKIIEILDSYSDKYKELKKQVLNAAAYFIHSKIKASYTFQYPTNSDLFKSLSTALGFRDIENYPTDNQTFDLYQSLCDFMELEVYHEEGLEKGFKVNHPFSTIKGYVVEDDIKTLLKKLVVLKCSALDAAAKPHKEKGLDKSTQKGIFLHTPVPVSNNLIPEYKATNKKSVTLFTIEHITIENKSDSEEAFEDQKVRAEEDADVTISRNNGI